MTRNRCGASRAACILTLIAWVCITGSQSLRADDMPANLSTEDQQRQAAIAEYTRQMQTANYPALFEKAAKEFNVPVDVLEGVSFAETRWTPLQWPPGETVSPDTGMPHAYGIMSLWDNDYFGHTLVTAAALIGQSPETLKTDTLQNIRGAAALLRQLHDTNPKPADALNPDQIESWRYAIAKYTGIPQPDLSARHALRVYEFMNLGYHEYGIEWPAHPVNLAPMRAEVSNLMAHAQSPVQSEEAFKFLPSNAPAPAGIQKMETQAQTVSAITANSPLKATQRYYGLIALLISGLLAFLTIVYLIRRSKNKNT